MHRFLACPISTIFLAFALRTFAGQVSQAQTFTVLHDFTGGLDGGSPYAGLSIGRAGNLYGTTSAGGIGYGTVFELSHRGTGWVFEPLYGFAGGSDGEGPVARVIVAANGGLYGTTYAGGVPGCSGDHGCGTVFNLRPPPSVCRAVLCSWIKTVLYRFEGGNDGANPLLGDLTFDSSGNLYGTTQNGGGADCDGNGCGTVFELSPVSGGWTEKVLYSFTGAGSDGANPFAGVIFDQSGNLYGTTKLGGIVSNGTVFRLTPEDSGWTESVLYGFQGESDGYWPLGGLIFDQAGNLYGTTTSGGLNTGGTVFELTSLGIETVLSSFSGPILGGPYGNLAMDAAGNLYGIAYDDGAYNNGSVFKLTPSQNGWTFTDLYDFTGGSDGSCPYGGVLIDDAGNLYGTTAAGGEYGYGVVWEITP
jgi:uncharacterized repeat protein (TIGR03803 family)